MKFLVIISQMLIALWSTGLIAEPRTGQFEMSATSGRLVGEANAAAFEPYIDSDHELEWSVYVSDKYDPSNPPGIVIGTEFFKSGRVPISWKSVLETNNLMWISATNTLTERSNRRSASQAFLAVMLAAQNYKINRQRVFFIGSGKVSKFIAEEYPQLFRGVVFNIRAESLGRLSNEKIEMMQSNAYAFWSGRDYFDNPMKVKRAVKTYNRAGIDRTQYREILETDQWIPGKGVFAETIEFFDADSE